MYTKEIYIKKIKDWIKKNGYNAAKIGNITFDIRIEHSREIDDRLDDALGDIAAMEGGPEFEMTEEQFYEYLDKI